VAFHHAFYNLLTSVYFNHSISMAFNLLHMVAGSISKLS
jgi:hypothetical protein